MTLGQVSVTCVWCVLIYDGPMESSVPERVQLPSAFEDVLINDLVELIGISSSLLSSFIHTNYPFSRHARAIDVPQ